MGFGPGHCVGSLLRHISPSPFELVHDSTVFVAVHWPSGVGNRGGTFAMKHANAGSIRLDRNLHSAGPTLPLRSPSC